MPALRLTPILQVGLEGQRRLEAARALSALDASPAASLRWSEETDPSVPRY